jgi:hypothetical protein
VGKGIRWSGKELEDYQRKGGKSADQSRKSPDKGLSEHEIQSKFVLWVRTAALMIPELQMAFAVPNGAILGGDEKLRAIQMGKLKREGFEPGVPDWCFPQPRGAFSGLWIEFKSHEGKVSEAQEEKIALLRHYGHMVHVCRSTIDAIDAVQAYLALDPVRNSL